MVEIQNLRALKEEAAHALRIGRQPKTVILYYTGATVLIAVLVAVCTFLLDQQIAGTGGLSNLGTRAIFSTAQALLPMAQSLVLTCLEMGYLHAMLRISRKQYADQTDLKVGFRKFFPILRLSLTEGMLFFFMGVGVSNLMTLVLSLTPWFAPVMEVSIPLNNGMIDPSMIPQEVVDAAVPMLILYVIGLLAVLVPFSYRLRMANYALLDDPRNSALLAVGASMKMTKGKVRHIVRMDLSFWWYHLLNLLLLMVCYGDVLLPMIGIQLPMSSTVSYYLFYGLYLIGLFAVTYFLRNRVECSYIMAYESICEKPKDSSVVLGNIFDMQ